MPMHKPFASLAAKVPHTLVAMMAPAACAALAYGIGADLSRGLLVGLGLIAAGALVHALAGAISMTRGEARLCALAAAFQQGDYQPSIGASGAGAFGPGLRMLQEAGSVIEERVLQVGAELDEMLEEQSGLDRLAETLAAESENAKVQLNQMQSAMAGVTAQTNQTTENAEHAMRIAREARDKATVGDNLMSQMVVSMKESDEAARSISRIIRVIDDIAFQTNLLALNAAVEAARAGRHGKGFAVVAEEVRNLAARSGTAAKETSELIEHGLGKVESATELASQTAAALSGIVVANTQFSDLVAEIATAAQRETEGLQRMESALQQLGYSLGSTRATAAQIRPRSDFSPGGAGTAHSQDYENSGDERGFASVPDDEAYLGF